MVLKHSVQNVRVPREVLCILGPQIGRREQQASVFRKDLIQLSMSPAFYVLHMQAVVFQSALAGWVGNTNVRQLVPAFGGNGYTPQLTSHYFGDCARFRAI